MRTPVFDSKKVSHLLERYVRHPHDHTLRQDIMKRVYPLIDAAITRKRLFNMRDDLRQECALKVLKGLRKFNSEKGSAFAFCWTIICNCLKTHGKRMSRGGLSLEEEAIGKEAETASVSVFQSPEYQYLQHVVSDAIDKALSSTELRVFHRLKDKKALAYIRKAVLSGDLFTDKKVVLSGLRQFGIKKKDARFLADYVVVHVRANLYDRKDFLHDFVHRKTVSVVSQITDR
jgi:hypothetical protein